MSSSETHPLVPLRLVRVVVRENSSQQWIFLEEDNGSEDPRGFPIVIGSGEATEIHRVVNDIPSERPLTHQLTLSDPRPGQPTARRRHRRPPRQHVLRPAPPDPGQRERRVDEVLVDARPSDALALALRAGARIRIAESVMEQVRTDKAQDPLVDGEGLDLDLPEDDDEL